MIYLLLLIVPYGFPGEKRDGPRCPLFFSASTEIRRIDQDRERKYYTLITEEEITVSRYDWERRGNRVYGRRVKLIHIPSGVRKIRDDQTQPK